MDLQFSSSVADHESSPLEELDADNASVMIVAVVALLLLLGLLLTFS
jgi:hypothetical protein